MFKVIRKEIEWGGRKLILETGKMARQADGAVIVSYGDTTLLCTAVAKKEPKPDIDFFPLTVVYQEKAFAAGKIPGGFFKCEGRPTEKETLTSRLIDRPIRPLFPKGFLNETQVICTVLSHDLENDPAIPAMIGASAALAISGIPFEGPIAGAQVGYVDDNYLLNPTLGQSPDSDLDLMVAGTESSVMMVESEANELSEEIMLGAVKFGHDQMQPVIKLINELAKDAGKDRWEVKKEDTSDLEKQLQKLAEKDLRAAYKIQAKQERQEKIAAVRQSVLDALVTEELDDNKVEAQFKELEKTIVRGDILKDKVRIDGRDLATVRPILSEVDILPRKHGSAVFTRGETQALVVTTLGTAQDEQRMDTLEGDKFEHFMLHYNFPPYSVGEANMLRGPGRREIGHGKLAWRALRAVMPTKEEFPYTIRIVSEITESNGSSSMATVCGSSLAMMSAGVPIRNAVSGIAMGLIKEGDDFAVLSDILGDEDHLGDMDFKVAGTKDGVTALQMDIKISGITPEIMQIALDQAKEGRLHILEKMTEAISNARQDVNQHAPKITTIQIPKDKIREVIGSGGKVIREICEVSGAKVDIEDDGTVSIAAVNGESADKALNMVQSIIAEIEVETIYDGKITRIVDFGAFVALPVGSTEGLVHISELENKRVEKVTDVVEEGQEIKVKVIGLERGGKIRLSMRCVNQETGEDISDQVSRPEKPAGKRTPANKPKSSGGSSEKRESRGHSNSGNKKRRYY